MVAQGPLRGVDPQGASEHRIPHGAPYLHVPRRADVVGPELELQREHVDGLEEAEAVREARGVGDAVFV